MAGPRYSGLLLSPEPARKTSAWPFQEVCAAAPLQVLCESPPAKQQLVGGGGKKTLRPGFCPQFAHICGAERQSNWFPFSIFLDALQIKLLNCAICAKRRCRRRSSGHIAARSNVAQRAAAATARCWRYYRLLEGSRPSLHTADNKSCPR